MRFLLLTIAMTMAFFINTAHAVTVSFDPAVSMVNSGGSVDVDLTIADLGAFAAPSLGAFNLEITYDNSIISFDSVIYSDFLGTAGVDSDFFTTLGAGVVGLDNLSFLSDIDLNALQGASFPLATLTFSGDSLGTSGLVITPLDFATAAGTDITSSILVNSGSIQVISSAVPEPATYLLMLSAFAVFAVRRKHGTL